MKFYDSNKVVYLFLKDEEGNYSYTYDGYEYYITNYTDNEFLKYKETVLTSQRYSTDIDISNTDKYLTLQTCVAGRPDLREIVICKEVDRQAYK